jgi:hypothetical protein
MKPVTEHLQENGHNRREFLQRLIRYPAVIALVAIGGSLELRSMKAGSQTLCSRGSLCQGCLLLPECELPQAVQSRETNQQVR